MDDTREVTQRCSWTIAFRSATNYQQYLPSDSFADTCAKYHALRVSQDAGAISAAPITVAAKWRHIRDEAIGDVTHLIQGAS